MNVILFDFDGVIVDTFAFCYRIIKLRDSISEDEYRARYEGNINNAPKKISLDPNAKPFDFISRYTSELMTCRPIDGMETVIKELSREYMLIIISSTVSPSIRAFLDMYDLGHVFKEILGNDVEKSKVKKIQAVLQRYSLKPSETIFITDTLGDIKEARVCGVESIAVTWGYHPITTLEKGSPYKIITHPSQIIETIGELAQSSVREK